jgi:hypothetical protein
MAWMRRCLTAVATVASVVVLASGCGSDGGSARGATEAPSVITATVPPSGSSGSGSSGSGSSGSSGSGSSAGGVPGAIDVRDPQGTYTMQISPDWVDATGAIVKEVEVWYVSAPDSAFGNNVNVLTQDTQGMDLREYIDYSESHLGGLELVSAQIVTGAFGQELGLLEYQGTLPGAPMPLHALATVVVDRGEAAVATLTTTLETFAAERVANERYLLTLQKTGRGSTAGTGTGSGVGTA